MGLRAENIKNVLKRFFIHSYDYFNRRYLRYQSFQNIQDFSNILDAVLQDTKALFVLSTGRCGTFFLSRLLKKIDGLDVHHEATPKLAAAAKYLYDHRNSLNLQGGSAAFVAARYYLIQDAYLFDKIYMETNNRLTFFAPFIQNVMPRARFIHLVRHPGDFVRSGMRRGYYSNNKLVNSSKIQPTNNDPFREKWASYSGIEKISWLWYETNTFIEDFKSNHPQKVLTLKSEHLFEDPNDTVSEMLDYMNLELLEDLGIEPSLKNEQKTGRFPRYEDWGQEDKEKMKAIVGELAAKYDYQL